MFLIQRRILYRHHDCPFTETTVFEGNPHSCRRQLGTKFFPKKEKTPTGNATSGELSKYNAFYAGNPDKKIIYLTFDAGYENGNTVPILDALKKIIMSLQLFLVVGNFLKENPDLVKRMQQEGHIVGNHTYTHPDMSKISTKEAFDKELGELSTLYQKTTGEEMTKNFTARHKENIAKPIYRWQKRWGITPFSGASPM